ncbi:hypothetical protein ACQP2F_15065 [Actinoplanes sp. CA-030573]|uniref:hypothetical protein n=1 Tax=Actinoplanes sp. CA-030573 TaxID=3239898 RepID=UPI003D926257
MVEHAASDSNVKRDAYARVLAAYVAVTAQQPTDLRVVADSLDELYERLRQNSASALQAAEVAPGRNAAKTGLEGTVRRANEAFTVHLHTFTLARESLQRVYGAIQGAHEDLRSIESWFYDQPAHYSADVDRAGRVAVRSAGKRLRRMKAEIARETAFSDDAAGAEKSLIIAAGGPLERPAELPPGPWPEQVQFTKESWGTNRSETFYLFEEESKYILEYMKQEGYTCYTTEPILNGHPAIHLGRRIAGWKYTASIHCTRD